jgi:hypothetical protein
MRKTLFAFLAILAFAPLPITAQNTITTVAGGGPNHLPALSTNLDGPYVIAQDPAGNLYIAATGANRVYKVDTTGQLTVFAGNGNAGYCGDGGLATDAEF